MKAVDVCCLFSPKIYQSLADKGRYKDVLYYTFFLVTALYASIMIGGYYFYAQFAQAPGILMHFNAFFTHFNECSNYCDEASEILTQYFCY